MGYYIQTKENLHKADQLLCAYPEIKDVTGTTFSFDASGATVLVCVVENGFFDAAVVCYCGEEYKEFKRNDGRPKRWLVLPRALAIKLCPLVVDLLPRLAKS